MQKTAFSSLLGIEHPIIQAPMVGVSTPALAAAVSNAGALGSIGLGASNVDQGRDLIRQTRSLTDKPFNVNMFCHRPATFDQARNDTWLAHIATTFAEFEAVAPQTLREIYKSFVDDRAMLEMLLEERPAVVSFHFGVPSHTWITELKAAGIFTMGCSTTLAEARELENAGVQAIVAQGHEAGGHRGVFDDAPGQDHQMGLFALLRIITSAVDLPVIAAGGIMDGAGINAAMTLGAHACQLGTAFILCPESSATQEHRKILKTAKAHETRITSYISGRPARGISNRLYLESQVEKVPLPAEYPLAYDVAKALHAAASAKGCHEFAAQWAGQGAPLARELPAAALIQTLVAEMRQVSPLTAQICCAPLTETQQNL
ncbi:nitronate monooxygenase [Pseudomonas cichorii]|uniref:Propionate 3-nitronate monooxygenase n=1 Tax=Pseudomonas lijiangensis TaxID=2995658 RepID=A0ABX8HP61_9PSED|nr:MULTISPECIES: nitronate monooxygenase [Pseudomonas syringae group]MBX8500817.1 nitronate monooxygenase [Pseudomonas lijiangensis]MBX8504619.1 nitronate monooxygenase [Pseudomonas lijiangensis]MBX8512456.1 nitronate monooxygenase [Pseudomonas cichorii]MBX8527409.1 nitronate monooxygenase [Pseudomonas cichorii]MBX8538076.1 nitronate monooxygenase [Pseudomonas cichorii]